MDWLELSFHTTHEAYDLVSNIFIEAGSKGVLLEDSRTPLESYEDHFGEIYQINKKDYPEVGMIVKGYLPKTSNVENELNQIRTRLLNLEFKNPYKSCLEVKILNEEDWASSWKQYYQPIEISNSLVIKPSWLPVTTHSSTVEIRINPGMAFGSGTHETTQLCLKLIEKYINANEIMVDVGTGSGILGIGASKLGAKLVYAVDLDEMAIIRAKENMVLNNCQNMIVEQNHLIEGVDALPEGPTLIVANILAPIIIGMIKDVKKILLPNKLFICSGIVHHEKELVLAALQASHFQIVEVLKKNGWVAIVSSSSRAK